MTHKLKEHEGQLQAAYAKLEMKAREAEALYKIGTEISAFLDVDKVLYLVAEKAHELLGSDVAVLCLLDGQELVVAAARGPADAFSTGGQGTLNCLERIGPCDSSKADGEIKNCTFACHVIREEYLKAHLAVPLKTRDKVIGALCVGNRAAREFIQTDVDLLSGLASQAAIAIENARLYEEIQGLAVLKERERIAQEMHDGLAQALGALHLKATRAQQHLSPGQTPKIEAALREISKIAEGAYEEVRQSIFGLRVMASKRLGLIPALAEYLHDFSLDSGIPVEIGIRSEEAARLPLQAEVQLVWIIREALANVKKHAQATRAWVTFEREAEQAKVTTADNGRGFDGARLPRRGLAGFGLQIMRERAESAGGRLNVESGPGQGTRVMVWLPLKSSRRL
jgi:signal transduction histidine kinase